MGEEMQFELLRLSMYPRDQVDGFERKKPDGTAFTREQWLRAVFQESIAFVHRGDQFHYVPDPRLTEADGVIAGRIGRQVVVKESTPPEAGLTDTQRDAWMASDVLIDPTHHPDGQKAAVEHKNDIGQPVSLFTSLVGHINAGTEPFILEAHAIAPSESFWNFVEANKGEVTAINFEFVAPNMFGHADDYDREMREMAKEERVQKARLVLESKEGLNPNTEKVKRAVEYTSKGAGTVKARTKRGKTYSSKAKAQRVSVPKNIAKEEAQPGLFGWLKKTIFGK